MLATVNADTETATKWSDFYRSRGFNPLPSRTDAKRPLVRFAQWWDEPAPDDLFRKHPTTNIQVMTGRRWRLLVIDLDGPEAVDVFASWGRCPLTWTTHSGGNGKHLWFRLPANYRRELPKAFLWRNGTEHAAVERLCDRSLIMAPPSIHPKTGQRYRFASKGQSPARLPMPAPCPQWVLDLKPLVAERPEFVPTLPMKARPVVAGRFRSSEVLDAIHDKISLVEQWGLRVASRQPNHAGWCPCHAIGREDRNPSASVSPSSGRYWEPGEQTIGLFELGVRLGIYLDWRDAVADLGRQFGAREVA